MVLCVPSVPTALSSFQDSRADRRPAPAPSPARTPRCLPGSPVSRARGASSTQAMTSRGAARPNGQSQASKICQFKLVLLGESAVGKSSLVLRFVKGQFHEYQESTIGGESARGSPAASRSALGRPQPHRQGFALCPFYFPLNASPRRALSPLPVATARWMWGSPGCSQCGRACRAPQYGHCSRRAGGIFSSVSWARCDSN